jgi:uncharacterized protein (DUF2344 family)
VNTSKECERWRAETARLEAMLQKMEEQIACNEVLSSQQAPSENSKTIKVTVRFRGMELSQWESQKKSL